MESNQLLLKFLSRPHTLAEVATQFGISLKEAESIITREVETGGILVSSRMSRASTLSNSAKNVRLKSSHPFTRTILPKMKPSSDRVVQNSSANSGKASLSRLRVIGPAALRASTSSTRIVKETARQRRPVSTRMKRSSVTLELKLLESIHTGAKQLSELRTFSDTITREVLGTFVRNGLLKIKWGPHGVGEYFAITERGRVELDRLKSASDLGKQILSKKLVSMKHVTL